MHVRTTFYRQRVQPLPLLLFVLQAATALVVHIILLVLLVPFLNGKADVSSLTVALPFYSKYQIHFNNCHRPVRATCIHSTPNTAAVAVIPNNNEKIDETTHSSTDDESATTTATFPIREALYETFLENIINVLIQSDRKRDSNVNEGTSSGWTNWIDATANNALFTTIQQVPSIHTSITAPTGSIGSISKNSQQAQTTRYIKWLLQSSSSSQQSQAQQPIVLDFSDAIHNDIQNQPIYKQHYGNSAQQQQQPSLDTDVQLRRLQFHMIVLPSDTTLIQPLTSIPASIIYGCVLYGGVTRYRLLSTENNNVGNSNRQARKVGVRTSFAATHTTTTNPIADLTTMTTTASNNNNNKNNSNNDNDAESSAWIQFGGPQRNYNAMNIGPCILVELIILPPGSSVSSSTTAAIGSSWNCNNHNNMKDMLITNIPSNLFHPKELFANVNNDEQVQNHRTIVATTGLNTDTTKADAARTSITDLGNTASVLSNKLQINVGGLQNEITEIVRRILDGRNLAMTHLSLSSLQNSTSTNNKNDMEILYELGLHPIRGLLLYGPPGCGKTHLAKEMALLINTYQQQQQMETGIQTPTRSRTKVVSAPELLDRWVGGTEKMVRELFLDAEQELQYYNGDPSKSLLHVIIIDEIDAVFRSRSSYDTGAEITRASAVNQILSKLDGITALDNILVIGLTNRRELLDPALLRPGRLEVQIEISLPNEIGRREILQIHFQRLRYYNRLSDALCHAIDGTTPDLFIEQDHIVIAEPRRFRLRSMIQRIRNVVQLSSSQLPKLKQIQYEPIRDLAADEWTGGFSGADIAGLVRNSASIALSRLRSSTPTTPINQEYFREDGATTMTTSIQNLFITLYDVECALREIKEGR